MNRETRSYITGVIVVAAVAAVVALAGERPGDARTILVWALAAAVGQHLSFPSLTGRGHVSLSTAAHVSMLLLLRPAEFLPALGLSRLVMAFVERKPWYRALFNTAQVVLAVLAGWLAFRVVAGPMRFDTVPADQLGALLGFLAGALGYYAFNVGAVSGVLALTGRSSLWTAWRANYGHRHEVVGTVALVLLAPLIAVAYAVFGSIGLLAFLLPMLFLYDASVRYVTLRRTQESVLRSQVQAAKAELAAEVGRDINTYLCVAQAHLEMLRLKRNRLDEGEYDRRLQSAHEQLVQIGLMSRGLLDFIRSESVIEPINVHELITNTVGFLEPQRRFRDVKLRLELDENTGMVSADPHQIQQVLVNLLIQAAERIAQSETAGHTITVGLRPHEAGDSIEIRVSDNGPPLPESQRRSMFEVGAEGPNGDVGRFIVHSIVRNHRGAISVEALPTAGTLCSVRLPCPPGSASTQLAGAR